MKQQEEALSQAGKLSGYYSGNLCLSEMEVNTA